MGTDAGTPFNFHGENAQELERMVALGMSPMQAILASTSAAARLIGIQDQVGTIEKGKLADLILFEGNPLRHIDLLRDRSRIIGVMQAGKFVAGPLAHQLGVRGGDRIKASCFLTLNSLLLTLYSSPPFVEQLQRGNKTLQPSVAEHLLKLPA